MFLGGVGGFRVSFGVCVVVGGSKYPVQWTKGEVVVPVVAVAFWKYI